MTEKIFNKKIIGSSDKWRAVHTKWVSKVLIKCPKTITTVFSKRIVNGNLNLLFTVVNQINYNVEEIFFVDVWGQKCCDVDSEISIFIAIKLRRTILNSTEMLSINSTSHRVTKFHRKKLISYNEIKKNYNMSCPHTTDTYWLLSSFFNGRLDFFIQECERKMDQKVVRLLMFTTYLRVPFLLTYSLKLKWMLSLLSSLFCHLSYFEASNLKI